MGIVALVRAQKHPMPYQCNHVLKYRQQILAVTTRSGPRFAKTLPNPHLKSSPSAQKQNISKNSVVYTQHNPPNEISLPIRQQDQRTHRTDPRGPERKKLLDSLTASPPAENQELDTYFGQGLSAYKPGTTMKKNSFMQYPKAALCSFETIPQPLLQR